MHTAFEQLKQRFHKEDHIKCAFAYNLFSGSVTRVFPQQTIILDSIASRHSKSITFDDLIKYLITGDVDHDLSKIQPYLFDSWGKTIHKNLSGLENSYASLTHFFNAIAGIFAQLIFDIFSIVKYALLFAPSLFAIFILSPVYLFMQAGQHNIVTDSVSTKSNAIPDRLLSIDFIVKQCLGNVLLLPYFVLAISVDLVRELLALTLTRNIGTVSEECFSTSIAFSR